ncbi:bifunctional 3,4-dihydroxy-2-butanone-4-phosphate synthase/GTP cyclohydrolase II [Oryzihumus leptocrescens]|uniref:Riboflavin biosynthesis protein RibBA n=1 Tax=Oryzihumus leptocrescens TaxID=297536 RepID=A0A542ZK62_9MICO|nr:bifunctional 3,4-dihydroxy-2-butanone-4-phosphate synthase/GTP cyclohydrolase II [Oryzihumus leptocrescens]TQL60734.1 3,4-dihydroxy 2-butanone 4-phosphate synthase/GTP cyclohydrolase II [Oryzihumus leptocrescens]
MTTALSTVEEALDALRRGLPVLVTDDEDRENEGDVILAAQTATEQWLAWTIRWSSGVVCAPMPDEVADRLELPPMVSRNEDPRGTAYTISVDAREGVTTGISAADRARTVNLLADPATEASDLVRPGHVFPLRAREGGVLVRAGHTEAAVDLCRLAGLSPVGVIAELVHDDGAMMRLPAVLELGAKHELPVITIEQLIAWRQRNDRVEKIVETRLPTEHGEFRVHGYRDMVTGDEHVALVSPKGLEGRAPLARLHSECLTGDVFGSQRCDCGPQLERAMERVGREGGVIVYLRGHEGRGVGLLHKLRAYALQDQGFDTVDAQVELGLPIDAREYAAGAAILADLGLHAVRLLTNNPLKVNAMRGYDIEVVAVERLSIVPGEDNEHYLRTKRDRMGHDLVIEATDKGASA